MTFARRIVMKQLAPLATLALVAALTACGQPASTERREEGVYGSSSGANPNLEDLQGRTTDPSSAPTSDAPASPAGSAYPSQDGEAPPPPNDGGRGSAETGATDGGDQN